MTGETKISFFSNVFFRSLSPFILVRSLHCNRNFERIFCFETSVPGRKVHLLALGSKNKISLLDSQSLISISGKNNNKKEIQFLNEIKIIGIVLILFAVIFSQLAPLYDKKKYGRV